MKERCLRKMEHRKWGKCLACKCHYELGIIYEICTLQIKYTRADYEEYPNALKEDKRIYRNKGTRDN